MTNETIQRLSYLIHHELGRDLLDGTVQAHRALAEAIVEQAEVFGLRVDVAAMTEKP